jgi:hypothetical protein
MGKNKKRSNEDLGHTDIIENSPKKVKEAKSASPHGKNQSPKRPHQPENGTPKSQKGTPKKPAPKLASVEDLFPGKRVAAHSVSLKNGFSGVLDNANGTEDEAKPAEENVELSKTAQKKLKKAKSAESLAEKDKASTVAASPKKVEAVSPKSKKMNGSPKKTSNGTTSDLALLFSEHDRLLPGPKRTSMTKSYTSSEP